MPILDIEIVAAADESLAPGLAHALADSAAAVFGLPTRRTWVKLHTLPADRYAENGVEDGATPRPVFVRVLKALLPEGDALRHEAVALASAIAKECGRPRENVHILYEPHGTGRIAFGGVLVGE